MKLTKGNLDTLDYNMGQYTRSLNDYYGPGLQIDKRTKLIPKLSGDDMSFMFKEGDKMRIPGVLDYTGAKYPFKKSVKKGEFGIKLDDNNPWYSLMSQPQDDGWNPIYLIGSQEPTVVQGAFPPMIDMTEDEFLQQGIRPITVSDNIWFNTPDAVREKVWVQEGQLPDKEGGYPGYTNPYDIILGGYPDRSISFPLDEVKSVGSKKNVGKYKKMLREAFNKDISDEMIDKQLQFLFEFSEDTKTDIDTLVKKFIEIYNLAGKPKIGYEPTAFQIFPAFSYANQGYKNDPQKNISSWFKGFKRGWDRPMINPLTNYIKTSPGKEDDVIDEFGHGLNENWVGENYPVFKEDLLQYIFEPSDAPNPYGSGNNYKNPYHNEQRAHDIMESLILNYFIRNDYDNFSNFFEDYITGKKSFIRKVYTPQDGLYDVRGYPLVPLPKRNPTYEQRMAYIVKKFGRSVAKDAKDLANGVKEFMSRTRGEEHLGPKFKSGSKIRIKKKNRGKFTEYCGGNVTQECIDKAKRSGNKKLIKRATFAENARKWNK